MITGGSKVLAGAGNRAALASHLVKVKDEHGHVQEPELGESEGLADEGRTPYARIYNALASQAAAMAGTRSKYATWHCHISPREGEDLTSAQWTRARQIYQQCMGLEGHSFQEVVHKKDVTNRAPEHRHFVFCLRTADGKAANLSFSTLNAETAMRIAEFEFGHEFTPVLPGHCKYIEKRMNELGYHDAAAWFRENSVKYVATPATMNHVLHQQENRLKLKASEVFDILGKSLQSAKNSEEFVQLINSHGLALTKGDKAPFVVVDRFGGTYELSRAITAYYKQNGEPRQKKEVVADIDAKLADIDRKSLIDAKVYAQTLKMDEPNEKAAVYNKETMDRFFASKSVFTDEQLMNECKKACNRDTKLANELFMSYMADKNIVTLSVDEKGNRSFAMTEVVAAEQSIIKNASAMQSNKKFAVSEAEFETYLAEWHTTKTFTLKPEQVAAVRAIVTGGGITAVEGAAGAGKTTMSEAARYIYERAGFKCIGLAPSNKAASALKEAGFSRCETIHLFLIKQRSAAVMLKARETGNFSLKLDGEPPQSVRERIIEGMKAKIEKDVKENKTKYRQSDLAILAEIEKKKDWNKLTEKSAKWLTRQLDFYTRDMINDKTVVFTDEFGMVGHELGARQLDELAKVGAKGVFIGDREQIQAVDRGTAFGVVLEMDGIDQASLREITRQKVQWQNAAARGLGSGQAAKVSEALAAYAAHDRLTAGIRGIDLDAGRLAAQAESGLGRPLSDGERAQLAQVAAYRAAAVEASALWRAIADEAKDNPAGHALYDAYLAARQAREGMAAQIATDIEAAAPWLSRFGVAADAFVRDATAQETAGMKTAEKNELIKDRIDEWDLTQDRLDKAFDFDMKLDTRKGARDALIAKWTELLGTIPADRSIIIGAYTNDDVAKLNAAAREGWRAAGRLEGEDIEVATVSDDGESSTLKLAVGDRVVAMANSKEFKKGMFGTITEFHDDGNISMKLDDGGAVVKFDPKKETLSYGYASTAHKLQGATFDYSCNLIGNTDRHLTHVIGTRHKLDCHLFGAQVDAATQAALIKSACKADTAKTVSSVVGLNKAAAGGLDRVEDRVATYKERTKPKSVDGIMAAARAAEGYSDVKPVATPRVDPKRAFVTTVGAAFKSSESGAEFVQSLSEAKISLVKNERGAYVVIDESGNEQELAKVITLHSKLNNAFLSNKDAEKDIAAKFADIDHEHVQTVHDFRSEHKLDEKDKIDDEPVKNLFKSRSVFSDEELMKECKKACKFDIAEANKLFLSYMNDENIVSLSVDEKGGRRFALRETIEAERKIIDLTREAAGKRGHAVSEAEFETYLDEWHGTKKFTLKPEQVAAVRAIVTGSDIEAIEGKAGAGKTTMSEAARYILEKAGYTCVGVAPSNKAASALKEAGFQRCETIHLFLIKQRAAATVRAAVSLGDFEITFENGMTVRQTFVNNLANKIKNDEDSGNVKYRESELAILSEITSEKDWSKLTGKAADWLDRQVKFSSKDAIDDKTVIFTDEFGMVGHELGAAQLDEIVSAGGKAVVIGDREQIQAVERGGAMAVMIDHADAARSELVDITRQRVEWQRQASSQLGSGQAEQVAAALSSYAEHGNLTAGIRGIDLDAGRLVAQAESALGREIDAGERAQLASVAAYKAAGIEASAMWAAVNADGKPKDHPLYADYVTSRNAREAAARAISENMAGAAPWLARFNVKAEQFVRDATAHEVAGMKKDEANEVRAKRAESWKISQESLDNVKDADLKLDTRKGARDALITKWTETLGKIERDKSIIIAAYTNADVNKLNEAAREGWKAAGRLEGPDVEIETVTDEGESASLKLAKGDRIVAMANSKEFKKGMFGTVTGFDDEGKVSMRLDDGGAVVSFDPKKESVAHGYSSTAHKLQGATFDYSCNLIGNTDRHLTHVIGTRHKNDCYLFGAQADAASKESLIKKAAEAKSAETVSSVIKLSEAEAGGKEKKEERARYYEQKMVQDELDRQKAKERSAGNDKTRKEALGQGPDINGPRAAGSGVERRRVRNTEGPTAGAGVSRTRLADAEKSERDIPPACRRDRLHELSELDLDDAKGQEQQGEPELLLPDTVSSRVAGDGHDNSLRRGDDPEMTVTPEPEPAPAPEPPTQAEPVTAAEPVEVKAEPKPVEAVKPEVKVEPVTKVEPLAPAPVEPVQPVKAAPVVESPLPGDKTAQPQVAVDTRMEHAPVAKQVTPEPVEVPIRASTEPEPEPKQEESKMKPLRNAGDVLSEVLRAAEIDARRATEAPETTQARWATEQLARMGEPPDTLYETQQKSALAAVPEAGTPAPESTNLEQYFAACNMLNTRLWEQDRKEQPTPATDRARYIEESHSVADTSERASTRIHLSAAPPIESAWQKVEDGRYQSVVNDRTHYSVAKARDTDGYIMTRHDTSPSTGKSYVTHAEKHEDLGHAIKAGSAHAHRNADQDQKTSPNDAAQHFNLKTAHRRISEAKAEHIGEDAEKMIRPHIRMTDEKMQEFTHFLDEIEEEVYFNHRELIDTSYEGPEQQNDIKIEIEAPEEENHLSLGMC